jgi:hypothetical protein
LQVGGPQRLEHPDLARLLHHEGDQRAQDAQRRHDHDEEQQVEHDVLLHQQRVEEVEFSCIQVLIPIVGPQRRQLRRTAGAW